jgi:hypothetical protein
MTRDKATKEAIKRWGKGAVVRAGERVSSPEDRAERLEQLRGLRARRDAIDAEIKAWLDAQPWYQAKIAERRGIVKALLSQDVMPYYKFSVGCDRGFAVEILGQGDT